MLINNKNRKISFQFYETPPKNSPVIHKAQTENINTKSLKRLSRTNPIKNPATRSISSLTSTNGVFKFETIIDDQNWISCYENNIHMKVFSELEIFLKSIFYKNLESVYKLLSFNSNLYQELFDSQKQTEQKNNVKIEYFEFDKNF